VHYNLDLISQANSVPLSNIFCHYNLNFINSSKILCPFQDHFDKSASFTFYRQTNSYYCFGCQSGSKCVDFVSKMDSISKDDAAKKILLLFDGKINVSFNNYDSAKEKLKTLILFSNNVLNFKKANFDKESLIFIEGLCMIYDDILVKHNLSNKALLKLTNLLSLKIKRYKK
jgi:hypothetical protein